MKKIITTLSFLFLVVCLFANRDSTGIGLSYEKWSFNPYFTKVNSTSIGFGKRLTFPGATITANGDSINVDWSGVYIKQGGNTFGAISRFGTNDNFAVNIEVFDTVRAKLTATLFEYENNRTGNQSIILADRTTAPAVGGYSSIDIGLANTVTTSLRSYHEVSGTGYSTGIHTLASGILNTTPALYATHLNKLGINRDTATYCLDVKGSGTDALLGRFQGNDENVFVYLQNSITGNASTDGLAISVASSDATINNRETGTLALQTATQNALVINSDQTVDLSAYDGARDASLQVTTTGRIERVEYAIGEIYVDDADPDTILFAGGSTTLDSLDDVTLGDTINFIKVGSSLKYIGTDTALFHVTVNFSFSFGESVVVNAALFKNQVEDTSIGFERKIGTGGDIGNAGCAGVVKVFPNDRVIMLFAPAAHTGDDNLIVDKYNISLHKLAKL